MVLGLALASSCGPGLVEGPAPLAATDVTLLATDAADTGQDVLLATDPDFSELAVPDAPSHTDGPLPCLLSKMCPEGEVCRIDPELGYRTCLTASGKALGTPCSAGDECVDGVCHDGTCRELCLSTASCSSGQCGTTLQGHLLCLEQDDCPEPSCPPLGYCNEGTCQAQNCVESADCKGTCRHDLRIPAAGRCVQNVGCSGSEITIIQSPGTCFVLRACWTDADCAEPYTCYVLSHGDPDPGYARLCGRASK